MRWAPLGGSSGTHQTTGVARHLLFPVEAVPHSFLPGSTRPTWAYPTRYTSALAFSVIPMLRLLGLPYGWADHDPHGPGPQLFHVLHSIQDTLGPLYTPAALSGPGRGASNT